MPRLRSVVTEHMFPFGMTGDAEHVLLCGRAMAVREGTGVAGTAEVKATGSERVQPCELVVAGTFPAPVL